MALQAEIIDALLVGGIERCRIRAGQKAETVGAVGVVAPGALPGHDGTMEVFLPLDIFLDILQRGGAEDVGIVATEAEIFFARGQQPFRL